MMSLLSIARTGKSYRYAIYIYSNFLSPAYTYLLEPNDSRAFTILPVATSISYSPNNQCSLASVQEQLTMSVYN